jgi:hypothetical protein
MVVTFSGISTADNKVPSQNPSPNDLIHVGILMLSTGVFLNNPVIVVAEFLKEMKCNDSSSFQI